MMTSYPCYMKADHRPPASQPLDLSQLEGDWGNLLADSRHIVRATLRIQNQQLFLRSYGANQPHSIDWGEIETSPCVAGQALIVNGFYACYELDGVRINLAANLKLGILVIYSYVSYHDESGRLSHHARDFFRRIS